MGTLTVLATSDVHGNALDWDYYADGPHTVFEVGLAQAATLVERIRSERGSETVVLVDNGDTIQGTPLDTFYAQTEPIATTGAAHPMAAAFNAMGYDAVNLGNHEFNYGFAHLRAWEGQLRMPLLGANVVAADAPEVPIFQAYTIVERMVDGKKVRVGILGITTPGSMVWDRLHLSSEGVVIGDMVEAARRWVPMLRNEVGCDVVVVLCHAGIGHSSYATGLDIPAENPADLIAAQVPGIDVMVIGHTHRDVPEQFITCEATGRPVLLTQPRAYAAGITETTLELRRDGDAWTVVGATAIGHKVSGEASAEHVVAAVAGAHERTRAHVNQQIATSPRRMGTEDAHWRPTEAIAFIQHVQARTVAQALAGADERLPIVSLTAPTSRTAVIPQGAVSIRDLAGIYIFDNTLAAVRLTGAQLRAHLEHAARYFADAQPGTPFDPVTMCGIERDGRKQWDYQFDIAAGIDYEIDITRPVGQRITVLNHEDGTPIRDDEAFAVALNHYRLSGAGEYPNVANAPVLYNDMRDIRQLLIDYAAAHGVEVPFRENWRVVAH